LARFSIFASRSSATSIPCSPARFADAKRFEPGSIARARRLLRAERVKRSHGEQQPAADAELHLAHFASLDGNHR